MITRREFVQRTTTGLFVAGVAPAILGADDKAGTRPKVVGQGDFQFECNHDWCETPDHITWRNTHGVAIDRAGFVYITHQGDAQQPCDTVVVFDAEGTFVRSFGKEFAGGGHGIDIRREGNEEYLYLCDIYNRQVIKCDTSGEWIWKIRYPRESNLYESVTEFSPTNVCFAANGDFYVADGYGAGYIHHYNINGQWLNSWGGKGKTAGKFQTPHGLWTDGRNRDAPQIMVADRANSRLQAIGLNGESMQIWQGFNEEKEQPIDAIQDGVNIPTEQLPGLSFPADIDIWDSMMVVADLHAKVLLFDENNQVVAKLGEDRDWTKSVLADATMRTTPSKWVDGKFIHPHDACFDVDGNLIVTEWVEPGRITKLTWI